MKEDIQMPRKGPVAKEMFYLIRFTTLSWYPA